MIVFIYEKNQIFIYTRGSTPMRVTVGGGGGRLRGITSGNTVPKKHRSGGEPLATLPAWESNPRPPALMAKSFKLHGLP